MASSAEADSVNDLGQKITTLLQQDANPPGTMFTMAWWILRNITSEDQTLLDTLGKTVGEDEANRWLVRKMVASGKYKSDDGESVERA